MLLGADTRQMSTKPAKVTAPPLVADLWPTKAAKSAGLFSGEPRPKTSFFAKKVFELRGRIKPESFANVEPPRARPPRAGARVNKQNKITGR